MEVQSQEALAPAQRVGCDRLMLQQLPKFNLKSGHGFAQGCPVSDEDCVLPGGPFLVGKAAAQGADFATTLVLGLDLIGAETHECLGPAS